MMLLCRYVPEAQGFMYQAGRWWQTNPKAENLTNLPDGYYEQLIPARPWIGYDAMLKGNIPMYRKEGPSGLEYDDHSMSEDLTIKRRVSAMQVGLDFGLTPSAVFGQKIQNGRWHILREIVTFDMGLERFAHLLKIQN